MPSIYKCVAVQQKPFVIKHEIRMAPVYKEEIVIKEEPEFDEEALRQEIRQQVLAELSQETAAILDNARQEADAYLSEAKTQAENMKQLAYAEGKEAGYQAGIEQGKNDVRAEMLEEINNIANSANAIVKSAQHEAQNMILEAERQIIDIALAVARKVLAREIEENPAVVLPLVITALEKVRDQEQIVVRVSMDDFELVNEAKHDLQVMAGCEKSLTVMIDPTITTGSCMIDTAYGSVDSRIDMQFTAIQKALQEVTP